MIQAVATQLYNLSVQFGNEGFRPPSPINEPGDPLGSLETIISTMVGFFTILGGIFFIFYFLQAAFMWISSGGDKSKLETARNKIINGVLGLILMAGSITIIGVLGYIIGLDILNPAQVLESLAP